MSPGSRYENRGISIYFTKKNVPWHIFGTQCLLFDRKFLRNFLSKNALPTCRTFSFRSLFYRNVIQSSPDIFSAQSGSLLLD